MKHEQDLTISGVVHDLNNVFQTFVDAADRLSGDPRWASLSAALFRSVERGKNLAASLQQSSTGAPFEEILNHAITFAEDSQLAGGFPMVHFESQVEPGIELLQNWAWERVLINLFLNAMRAMPLGGTIHVDVHRGGDAKRGEGTIEIRVRDEGSGIPSQILDSLFQPYVSAHSSSGLGLHIVETIVKEDGGKVEARNLPLSGAEFVITLPESAAAPRRTRIARP